MCEIFNLDYITELREVQKYCSDFYKKLGLSHKLSAIVSNSENNIFQCTAQIFANIQIKNVYFKIVQNYVDIQHKRYGCGVKTFIAMLGCLLHYIIILLEEKINKRYLIQGIQEGLEILIHLFRKSGKKFEDRHNFTGDKIFGRDATEYLKNQITKYINISKPTTDEDHSENNYSKYVEFGIYRLCHYESVDMKNILWEIVKGILFPDETNEARLSANQDSNPMKSIGVLLRETFTSPGLNDLNNMGFKFKDDIQNIMTLSSTQFIPNNIENFSIHPGILLYIKIDAATILNKFTGLKNCLLFLCDIDCNITETACHTDIRTYTDDLTPEYNENNWKILLLSKIKAVQVNCIILSGKCDCSLRDEFLINLDIAVIEDVSPRILSTISSIMDVNLIYDINSMFTSCQLLIDIVLSTKFEKSLLCSIQIPQWMKIFGVTSDNLKTVIVHHPSMEIAEALRESFNHNLKRIENSISIGYYLDGGGSLEVEFAAELKARANNKITHSKGVESIEMKCKAFLAITKGLELFNFHLKSNLTDVEGDSNYPSKIDDLESKIGSIELLSECLTSILSTNTIILSARSNMHIEK